MAEHAKEKIKMSIQTTNIILLILGFIAFLLPVIDYWTKKRRLILACYFITGISILSLSVIKYFHDDEEVFNLNSRIIAIDTTTRNVISILKNDSISSVRFRDTLLDKFEIARDGNNQPVFIGNKGSVTASGSAFTFIAPVTSQAAMFGDGNTQNNQFGPKPRVVDNQFLKTFFKEYPVKEQRIKIILINADDATWVSVEQLRKTLKAKGYNNIDPKVGTNIDVNRKQNEFIWGMVDSVLYFNISGGRSIY